nr:DHA2 family efflux MFS transporter permease subunit [Comamonas serinivorans]
MVGPALVLGTLALSLATFMNVLDSTIANVSLSAIAGDMGVSTTQGTWVITSFGVANAISVPLTGWLTQRFGAVRLFVLAVLMFSLASWLCGFALSFEMLVACRVLQGAFAGPMIPLSQTLLLQSYPPEKSGIALALWGMTTLVAPVVGPLLGGWITDNISWPWIFYINVPVGALAAFMTWVLYKERDTERRKLPIDGVGLVLLVVWVGCMQLVLDLGKEQDWYASMEIVWMTIVAVVAFVAFLIWELTERHPVVHLRLFAQRNFLVGSLTMALAYGLFFGNVVLLPLWLQQWMGYTAIAAGMALAPVGLFAILLTPLVGKKVGTWDPRAMASFAFAVFALVLWLRAQFTTDTDFFHILIPTVLQGVGVSMFFVPLTTLTLAGQPPHMLPAAAGLSNFVRITAGAVGTSISTTLWESRATLHHAHLTESLHQGNTTLVNTLHMLQAKGLSHSQALAQLDRLVNQQAWTRAADDIFFGSACLFLVLIVAVWFCDRPAPHAGGGAEAAAGAH